MNHLNSIEPYTIVFTKEEPIEDTDDSDKKNITNIYISDSVINRSIIGEKDDKDE